MDHTPEEMQPSEQRVQATEGAAVETEASSAEQSDKERNFRILRERAEAVEREKQKLQKERDAYYQRLQQIEQQAPAPQEENNLAPDDLVEWKYVQKELKKVHQELDTYKQQSQAVSAETRLKMQYPDFETVVNDYNIQRLRSEYPEIAATIATNNDVYTKASAAYTMIKKLNIMPSDAELKAHARVQDNAQKPRPSTTLSPQQGESPLQRANAFAEGLTPELRAQLLKEMREAKKHL